MSPPIALTKHEHTLLLPLLLCTLTHRVDAADGGILNVSLGGLLAHVY